MVVPPVQQGVGAGPGATCEGDTGGLRGGCVSATTGQQPGLGVVVSLLRKIREAAPEAAVIMKNFHRSLRTARSAPSNNDGLKLTYIRLK